MPYINQSRRRELASLSEPPVSEGELNYLFTMICRDYLSRYGTSYATINTLVGALECAKSELYRRVAAPHEDRKCAENGDVYGTRP